MPRSLSPVPGWGPPPRGLFVDIWGTLLELPSEGWTNRFQDARFTPGALDALFHARQAGWKVYLLGNIDQVAFGQQTLAAWEEFKSELHSAMQGAGVAPDRDYTCSDNPEGVEPNIKDSVYLLPNTGAMYHAAQVDRVSLKDSIVIGDSSLELVAGWRAGCRTAAVKTGLAVRDGAFHIDPDLESERLSAAVLEVIARTLLSA